MITPCGIEIAIGQRWQEVDPRFERIVRVTNTDNVSEKVQIEPYMIGGRGSGARWAKLSRFNGKRTGYKLVSTP
jgi:hypothetical protein